MLFITAGMGGGTGTGAAPVIAALAKELDILTIAVVTIPSPAEGKKRFGQAIEGIKKLRENVDSLLVISNQKLRNIYGDLPAREAFKKADNIVTTAVKGVAEIITVHGNINIDYTDVHTVMANSKVFIMGTGYASGENRAMAAVHRALESPLLDSNDIYGTKNILLNIISGKEEITIGEIGEIIELLQEQAGQEADIIWGNGYDESLGDNVCVTILATGFETDPNELMQEKKPAEKFELKDQEPDINYMDDETEEHELNPLGNVGKDEVLHLEMEKPVYKKKKKEKRKKVVQGSPQDGPIDNWFNRQFSRFFDGEDQSS